MARILLTLALIGGLGRLWLSLAPVAAAGGGCPEPLTVATGSRVEMRDACFVATVLQVEPGTEVEWVNRDKTWHNVVAVGAAWRDTGSFGLDQSTSATFEMPGVYPYYCAYHPGMVGVVVVGEAAASGATAAWQDVGGGDPGSPARLAILAGSGASVALVTAGGLALRWRRRRSHD